MNHQPSQDGLSRIQIGILILWATFALLFLSGPFTVDAFRIIFPLTVIYAFSTWNKPSLLLDLVRRKTSWPLVYTVIAGFFVIEITAIILDYEGLDGTLGDLTTYLQCLHNYATTGRPFFTFNNEINDYFFIHRTLSIYAVGALYKFFRHPYVDMIWQGFFLFSPGLVSILWYQAVCRRHQRKIEPLGVLFSFFTFALMPTVLLQALWPTTFHIGAFTFLALSYLFYYERKWGQWAISLICLAFEKEEYGAISVTFAFFVVAEELFEIIWSDRALFSQVLVKKVVLGALAAGLSLYSFFSLKPVYAVQHTFKSFYGSLGATPLELVKNFFHSPYPFRAAFTRHMSLVYFAFFILTSFVWLWPKWKVAKYFVPVFPLLLLGCIASNDLMQLLKDYYALPFVTGVCAVHILGILSHYFENEDRQRERDLESLKADFKAGLKTQAELASSQSMTIFILITLFPLLWNHQSLSRTFLFGYHQWKEHQVERELLKPLQNDRTKILCCEDRLCSYVGDRRIVLSPRQCVSGSPLFKDLIGQEAVFLIYSKSPPPNKEATGLPIAPYPTQWAQQTGMLKLSGPVKIQTSPTQ